MAASESEIVAQPVGEASEPDSMESLVQQGRRLSISDLADELHGELEVPDEADMSGGYADVYHGTWTNPQGEKLEVAIKVFKKIARRNKYDDETALVRRVETRVKREAFIWSRTKHANLHPFLGYRSQPRPSLISPWCRHGNLSDYLRASPGLPRVDRLILIFQTACGLEHLHSQTPPICHGDIKPENVLVNDRLEAVLTDFGLGRVLMDRGVHTGFTTSDTAHGTLVYMAGELFAEAGSRSNLQTDIYAFSGLTLAVMSGKSPFFGLQTPQVMARLMQYQQPRSEDHPEIPPSDPLWSLMRRCWDKVPDSRPVMEKIFVELREYIHNEDPHQSISFSGETEELRGRLEIPGSPEIQTTYSYVYRGIWEGPRGGQVEVAIKVLGFLARRRRDIDTQAQELRLLRRVNREASRWRVITHPNLHPFLGYRSQPELMLISPWCRHGNIANYLERKPGLSRLDKLRLICQAACGLEHLHSKTPLICHGNLKPQNVLINDRLEVVLSDFGVDRLLKAEEWWAMTQESHYWGLEYLAPELMIDETPRRNRETDVFAFGGLLLAVMSGKPPFYGHSAHRIIFSTISKRQPTPEQHPELPSPHPLWSLMRGCWSETPKARPTMQEVLRELTSYIYDEQSGPLSRPSHRPVFNANEDGDGDSDANLDAPNPTATTTGRTTGLASDPAPEALASVTTLEECIELDADSTLRREIFAAQEVFEPLNLESKDMVVVGRYIEAAAKIGLTLLEIVQTVNSNEDMSTGLGSNARKLADLLENLKEVSSSRQIDNAILCVTEIQKVLQCVGQKLLNWCFSDLLKDSLSSCDEFTRQRGEEMVKDVLRKVQPLAGSDTINLIAELQKS